MATGYVRSTDGNNVDAGSTWELAKLDGAGAAAIDTAGDTIWFSQVHAESTAAAVTWNWAGTTSSQVKLLCGNDSAEPPTALATTGTVTTSGAGSNLSIAASGDTYIYGLTFVCGSGATNTCTINTGVSGAITDYDTCNFQLAST